MRFIATQNKNIDYFLYPLETEIDAPAIGGEVSFKVIANCAYDILLDDRDGLIDENTLPLSGNGNMVISCTANETTGFERVAHLSFQKEGSDELIPVTISQAANVKP